jgi:DNA-binding NtrC family response regulator
MGEGTGADYRILVVDDEPAILRILERVLCGMGEVLTASDVDEGLKRIDGGVDLVITDVRLGARSGVEIARAAAAHPRSPPVIAMSGYAEASDGLELGKAGVAAFISKPFSPEDMLDLVRGLQAPKPVELEAAVRRAVGAWALPRVIDATRRLMVFEALARTQGNKTEAAHLLGISRQHLQKILSRGKG